MIKFSNEYKKIHLRNLINELIINEFNMWQHEPTLVAISIGLNDNETRTIVLYIR